MSTPEGSHPLRSRPGIDHTGVSVVFYCTDGRGRFLLHKRSATCRDERSAWDAGGGHLEFGESFTEGVLREVLEEYGCHGQIKEQLPAYSLIREVDGNRTHWVGIPFIILVDPKEVKIGDPEAIDEIGWFSIDKLPEPLHTGLKYARANYMEYFSKYQ